MHSVCFLNTNKRSWSRDPVYWTIIDEHFLIITPTSYGKNGDEIALIPSNP